MEIYRYGVPPSHNRDAALINYSTFRITAATMLKAGNGVLSWKDRIWLDQFICKSDTWKYLNEAEKITIITILSEPCETVMLNIHHKGLYATKDRLRRVIHVMSMAYVNNN